MQRPGTVIPSHRRIAAVESLRNDCASIPPRPSTPSFSASSGVKILRPMDEPPAAPQQGAEPTPGVAGQSW